MLPQETYHHLVIWIHFETRTRRKTKAPKHPWIHSSRVGPWRGPFSVLQQMGVEAKARATEEERVNKATCTPGTYEQQSSSTTKWPCSSPPKFLVTYAAGNNKSSVYTLETWWCRLRPKDSLIACLRAKISRHQRTFYLPRKRVCNIDGEELWLCGMKKSRSRAQKTSSFSPHFVTVYTADRKKWSNIALEIRSLSSSLKDSFWSAYAQTYIDVRQRVISWASQDGARIFSLYIISSFTTVLTSSNGRLDQRAWFKNDMLEDCFERDVHTLRWASTDTQRHRQIKTPPAAIYLWEGQRIGT